MADALVSFMLERLGNVIVDNIKQEVNLVLGAEEEVEDLKTNFKLIQAVLNDAELRQIKDEAVKLWLEKIKDIAYDMDDVLDEWSYEMHKSQNDDTTGLTGVGNKKKKKRVSSSYYLCSLCSCFNKVALHHNIGIKIKEIKERLDKAVIEKKKYDFVESKSDEKPIQRLKTTSVVDVSDILGRATDKETIMSKLMFMDESSTSTDQPKSSSTQGLLHAPNIISIVGMGGLGKTTLAQLVFNDDQVKAHFKKTMWVCVSDPFDLVTVAKEIIKEAECVVPNTSVWNNELHNSLTESIKGKLFLLVLDDVWTDDPSIWKPFELSFRNGAKGSRILVTTRNERVSLMMNAKSHLLEVLSDNDCSSLLCRIALAGRNNIEKNVEEEELRKIGEVIATKCKGLPLAAITLGGLLRFKKTKNEWLNILDSEIWKLEGFEKGFSQPALLLSYYDLPLPLKSCFVYCSIFPKDYIMDKDFLVKLWMAQGFLKPTSENEELEMIGDDYFNNLAMRSFFQDFSKDENGNINYCKMHDLVHDLALSLTENECAFAQYNGSTLLSNIGSRVRHLSLEYKGEEEHSTDSFDHIASSIYNAKKLRTLQHLPHYSLKLTQVPADFFHHLRCLKVLCLNFAGLESLSSEIENLIHLRHLDLSNNYELKILPETITSLYNLQTLDLSDCYNLQRLPREMRRLIKLRHLHIRGTGALSHIPQGIGALICLRTLSNFVVGGDREGCRIGELKDLNHLQGNLRIKGLGRVEAVSEAFEIKYLKQKQLHTLTLDFEPNEGMETEEIENEDLLDALEPHPDVVELELRNYLGSKLSRWFGGRTSILPYMKTLKLYECINLTEFPAFGQLPSLEVLDIQGAKKVKHIGLEFYTNNNVLEQQHVNNSSRDREDVMPCLRSIKLFGCEKLKALPALGKLQSLEELTIGGGEELTHIGCEFFYEVDEEAAGGAGGGGGRRFNEIAFPKLKTLSLNKIEFDELELLGEEEILNIMPCLREVEIWNSKIMKRSFVEILSKISSLESLEIGGGEATEFIKYIRRDDDDDDDDADDLQVVNSEIILFPNLKQLKLGYMEEMEELKIGFQVMPLLNSLTISNCNKLKAILPFLPNLKYLELSRTIHPSLPEACATTFQALEHLTIKWNHTMTCMPKEIQQLTSLKSLELRGCGDELKQRCRKDQGEDWRIISHIPLIIIDRDDVRR